MNPEQARVFQKIGGQLVSEELRSFRTVITQLGSPILTFERLVDLLEKAMDKADAGIKKITEKELEQFYQPLWKIINDLLPDTETKTIERLKAIPFLVTEDLYLVTINMSCLAPAGLEDRIAKLLPKLAIASHRIGKFPKITKQIAPLIGKFPKITKQIAPLTLKKVVVHIRWTLDNDEPVENVIDIKPERLKDLYKLFAELDNDNVEKSAYEALKKLPIWLSSQGDLIEATQALLPGDFSDPIGQVDFLDTSVLSTPVRDFILHKLDVKEQTIHVFVQEVLPRHFDQEKPLLDEKTYEALINELARHPKLLEDEDSKKALTQLPIVPTQDGNWQIPTETYRRKEEWEKVLGDAKHLWLDDKRLPNAKLVGIFIDNIGLLKALVPKHLIERMIFIAEKFLPTEQAKKESAEVFYVLCDFFNKQKEQKDFKEAIDHLKCKECFPAMNDEKHWYSARDLYAPYRVEAFSSQAKILDFRKKLNEEFLKELGIKMKPETNMVIEHLNYCVEQKLPTHKTVYQILNERSKDESDRISSLSGEPIIYIEAQEIYVCPNQIFWKDPKLGRYAFSIPETLSVFKDLFTAIGVKDAPNGKDYTNVLLDIVEEHSKLLKSVEGADRQVYDSCMKHIVELDEKEEIDDSDIQKLRETQSILNLKGNPTYPDEVLLHDSEWHKNFFKEELDQSLCKSAPEQWLFMRKLGVQRLSQCTKVELDFIEGQKNEEPQIAEKLKERIDIFMRVLHEEPTTVKQKVRGALAEITAISYDRLRIKASVYLNQDRRPAPASSVPAFYAIEKEELILCRPVGNWAHILRAIFDQLMMDTSRNKIPSMISCIKNLMSMSVEEAHQDLADAGYPLLEPESEQTYDLTSSSLGNMGIETSPESFRENETESHSTEGLKIERDTSAGLSAIPPKNMTHIQRGEQQSWRDQLAGLKPSLRIPVPRDTTQKERDFTDVLTEKIQQESLTTGDKLHQKPRPEYKKQRDQRLLSYARKDLQNSGKTNAWEGRHEQNMKVEVFARHAVCTYEKARGRSAEQMAQTHPGYDIISKNPLTGEERLIEVKGISGEWNQVGVSLSRFQFSNAWDEGDRYWLYVVEFCMYPQPRVYPIRNPATQVTQFMFDENWRDVAVEEAVDPVLAFIPGARVRHNDYGMGEIVSMKQGGLERVLTIKFETSGQRTITLNLRIMTVIDEDDDGSY